VAVGRGKAAKADAAKRAERNAVRLLRVLRQIPEAERLDALTIALDVWIKVPSLMSKDRPG
jgi:Holliday junction resolvasome RuvABC endonuclease subunit